MTKLAGVEHALQKGMAFIAMCQQPNGAFSSFSSPSQIPFIPAKTYRTTFTPALILSALSRINTPNAQKIRDKTAQWLLNQKSPQWSFNYWAADAPERTMLPYPDDLDDTFCSLIALHGHDPSLIDETCLAHAVKLLVATETQLGGPYKTWLTASTDAVWQDVDLAVNANIGTFLSLVAKPLPNLQKLMKKAVTTRSFQSPYYPTLYPIVYYIARAYENLENVPLVDCILELRKNGHWQTPLQTALALSSLARLNTDTTAHTKAVQFLLQRQSADGSWPAEAFCLDPALQGRSYYNGAAALTTAFAIEALGYSIPHSEKTITTLSSASNRNILYEQILTYVRGERKKLGGAVKKELQAVTDRTIRQDTQHKIVLLPQLFHASLIESPPVNSDLFIQLGTANLFGWTAYTIYDDFLDGEGQPSQLSAANVALRSSLHHFKQALPTYADFHEYVDQIFDCIDNANSWEVQHCRLAVKKNTITIGKLPRYATSLALADRSQGHALSPLGILAASGIDPADPRAIAIRLAMRHYLAARQLSDDMHDWEQDTKAGIATYVVVAILRGLQVQPGDLHLDTLLPKMQQQFWHHTMHAICQLIQKHAAAARRAAARSNLLKKLNIITELTKGVDDMVALTLQEQEKAENFLAAYRKPNK